MEHSESQAFGSEGKSQKKILKNSKSRLIGRGHSLPVGLFLLWVLCEYSPVMFPDSMTNYQYLQAYYYTEDLATILLALACYTALSYTSMILKGISLTVVVIASGLMISNAMVDFLGFDKSTTTAFMVAFVLIALQLFMTRFVFRMDHTFTAPEPDRIYLIVTKPHDLWGMAGLFWSGIGGGFSAYVDGTCYWFSREAGVMVKEYDPDYCKGRQLIDCGIATKDKIEDLDNLVGCKWSIWNNCFTVFGRWRRAWPMNKQSRG